MTDSSLKIPENEVLFIGYQSPFKNNKNTTFRPNSAGLLTDYKIIIVRPISVDSITYGSNTDFSTANKILSERYKELLQFLSNGGLVITTLSHLNTKKYRDSYVTNYSFIAPSWGTSNVSITERKGKIILTDQGKESSFCEYLKEVSESDYCVEITDELWGDERVNLQCYAKNTQGKWVAFEARYKNRRGKMIFVPQGKKFYPQLMLKCAVDEYNRLIPCDLEPATWVYSYSFPKKEELETSISEKKQKIEKTTSELVELEDKLYEQEKVRNILLNGQGQLLEDIVRKVFFDFGLNFEKGPEGRDDLVLKDSEGKTKIVCEVKGIKSSAAERFSSQLEKWRLRVFDEESHEPKGLLIVNTWCETDPIERPVKGKDFPDQMLPFSIKREFCLMTTVQLYNIWCAFKKKEIKGKEIMNLISNTIGALEEFKDISENRIK